MRLFNKKFNPDASEIRLARMLVEHDISHGRDVDSEYLHEKWSPFVGYLLTDVTLQARGAVSLAFEAKQRYRAEVAAIENAAAQQAARISQIQKAPELIAKANAERAEFEAKLAALKAQKA